MTSDGTFAFYGDFNCPFCFAQSERIQRTGLQDRVHFRPIQHMPGLPTPWTADEHNRAEIDEELGRLKDRATEITIGMPFSRPNTEPATMLYAEASQGSPRLGWRLAHAIYRALWIHSRDISSKAVLAEVLASVGAPGLEPRSATRRKIATWQREWGDERFGGRLPVLASPHGAVLLGLADQKRLEAFLRSGRLNAETDDVCKVE